MHRGALRLGAILLALAPCLRVFAHGFPPIAYAVVSHDASGVRAVSFSNGVALRRSAQRYQFVCPAAWGNQFPGPVVALADGTILLGTTSGLKFLSDDGTLSAHPDPSAVGHFSDVVRSSSGTFSLRTTTAGSEVLAVDAQTVRVLWKDPNTLFSLAAVDDELVVVRPRGRMIEQVTIAAKDGAELERQIALVDFPLDYAYARADAGTAYALLVLRNGTMQIGTVRMSAFTKLADGMLSIAGPLSVGTGALLALDGKLAQWVGGQATPLADDRNVVCLGQADALTYACESDGISKLAGQMLGEPLFRFGWLVPPELERVPAGDARMACVQQWQDLLSDLQLGGISLLEGSPPVAGSAAPAAGGGGAGAVLAGRAAAPAAAGSGSMVAPPRPPRGGCAAVPGRREPGAAGACALGLVLGLALRRRRVMTKLWVLSSAVTIRGRTTNGKPS